MGLTVNNTALTQVVANYGLGSIPIDIAAEGGLQ